MTMYTTPKNLIMSTCTNGLDATEGRKKEIIQAAVMTPAAWNTSMEKNHDSPASETDGSPDVSLDVPDRFDIDSDVESVTNEESNGQLEYCSNHDQSRLLNFKKEHPLADSHGIRYIRDNASWIPNFIGKNLPR